MSIPWVIICSFRVNHAFSVSCVETSLVMLLMCGS